jgi:hypothetical protein
LATRSKTSLDQPRTIRSLSLIAFVMTSVVWLAVLWQTDRPWINPSMLVPVGLVSLLLLRTRPRVRSLFIALYLAEMLVAIYYIPLVRLRWTVDFLLIISIAIEVSRVCDWIQRPSSSYCPSSAATKRDMSRPSTTPS